MRILRLISLIGILRLILNIRMKRLLTNIWNHLIWSIYLIKLGKLRIWRLPLKKETSRRACFVRDFHWEKSTSINTSIRWNNTIWTWYKWWNKNSVRKLSVKITRVIKTYFLNRVNWFSLKRTLMNFKGLSPKLTSITWKLMKIMYIVMEKWKKLWN